MTDAPTTSTRARPLPTQERREALIDATLTAIREHRCSPSTRQIAQAAGVAEGTIFRVFASKDELIEAAVRKGFDPSGVAEALAEISPDQPLRDRLVAVVRIVQARFTSVFELMSALGMSAPPQEHLDSSRTPAGHHVLTERLEGLLEPEADRLRVPPAAVVNYLRLLAFSGSHPEITHGNILTPEEIVDTILHGVLADRCGQRP